MRGALGEIARNHDEVRRRLHHRTQQGRRERWSILPKCKSERWTTGTRLLPSRP